MDSINQVEAYYWTTQLENMLTNTICMPRWFWQNLLNPIEDTLRIRNKMARSLELKQYLSTVIDNHITISH